MDLGEAVHAQTLIDWLTDPHATTQGESDAARDAAAWLADRAHHVRHTGPTGSQVLLAWDDLLQGCPGCPTCTPGHDGEGLTEDIDDQADDDAGPAHVLSGDEVRQLVAEGWLTPAGTHAAAATPAASLAGSATG
jgi:hypothetical protein